MNCEVSHRGKQITREQTMFAPYRKEGCAISKWAVLQTSCQKEETIF